jgi:hypothetical protein
MTGKEILDNCKSPFPYLDEWVKKQCIKEFKDKKKALMYFVYIRSMIQVMNELNLYNLTPDEAKKHIVQVFTTDILKNSLIAKGWEKYDKS